MSAQDYDHDDASSPSTATRAGPTLYALIGVLVGLALGFALAWAVGGNPFSGTNEVEFVDLTVASVSEEADRLCWAEDPDRRDSALQCAVLALDPAAEVPEEGAQVTVGLVDLRAPGGTEVRQVVHVEPAGPREAPTDAD